MDDALLSQFTALDVELDFVRQVNAPFARTMNKFSAFYRASAHTPGRFDHFLWLDADVFVLGDPLPLLRSVDLQDGKIYCVPEVSARLRMEFELSLLSPISLSSCAAPCR